MVEKEQEYPLAPASHRIDINTDTTMLQSTTDDIEKMRLRRRCIQCCGCTSAVIVITGLILLILFLTVFKVKDPETNLNSVTIIGLEGFDPRNLVPDTNLTIIANVSVKNPNIASFSFQDITMEIYYEDVQIGDVQIPNGNAKAKKTFQMNVTIDFMLEKISSVPRLVGDLTAGGMPLRLKTSMRGRVEIIDMVEKTVGVKMECSLRVVIADQSVQDQKCTRSVKF